MAVTIEYKEHSIKLTSARQGIAYPWGEKNAKEHHRIFVSMGNLKPIRFSYYCNDCKLKEYDLLFAFYCFLLDGIYYHDYSYGEFLRAFGYDYFDGKGKRAYNGCRNEWYKWMDFKIDPYKLSNWLQEKYDF